MLADAVLDVLTRLVDRSLVLAEEDGEGHARFQMLETLREYALERLRESGEADVVQGRHLAYYTALAEAAAPALEGPTQRGGSTGWSGSTTTAAPPCAGCWRTPSRRPSSRGCASSARCPGSGDARPHARGAGVGRGIAGAPVDRRASGDAGACPRLDGDVGRLRLGDSAPARARREEGLALARAIGDPRAVAESLR